MLTPQEIQQANQITGRTVPPTGGNPVPSRADEIRNIAKQATTPKEESGVFNEPTFKASDTGNLSDIPVNTAKTIGNIPSSAARMTKDVLKPTADLLNNGAPIIKDIFQDGAVQGVKNISSGFADTYMKIGQSIYGGAEKAAHALNTDPVKALGDALHYIATKGIEDPLFIPSLMMGGGEAAKGEGAAKDLIGTIAKPLTEKPLSKTKELILGTPEEQAAEVSKKLLNDASKRVTPDYESMTPTQKSKIIGEQSVDGKPRVNEGGVIKGRTVNQTQQEIDSAKELTKIPGYSEKLSNLQTHDLIVKEIKNEATALRKSVAAEKVVIPKKEILSTVKSAIDKAGENSLLLSKSDPIIENYLRIAERATSKAPGNAEGILDVRQALDDAYYNNRGSMAYGDTRINSLDEIHKSSRTALNDMLKRYSKTSEASLEKQTNLYRADDVVNLKAAKEGSSKIEKISKKYPKTTKVVKAASRIVGLGEVAGHLAH